VVQPETHPLQGILLDEACEFSLRELATACDTSAEILIAMVEEGLLEPRGVDPRRWRFPAEALVRARTALHLQRDLGVNLAGAALAVDLLEEIRRLRRRLQVLQTALEHHVSELKW